MDHKPGIKLFLITYPIEKKMCNCTEIYDSTF